MLIRFAISVPDPNVSVKDRIKSFEASRDFVARPSEDKPRRKKPQSEAFEQFEANGILIGYVSFLAANSYKH